MKTNFYVLLLPLLLCSSACKKFGNDGMNGNHETNTEVYLKYTGTVHEAVYVVLKDYNYTSNTDDYMNDPLNTIYPAKQIARGATVALGNVRQTIEDGNAGYRIDVYKNDPADYEENEDNWIGSIDPWPCGIDEQKKVTILWSENDWDCM